MLYTSYAPPDATAVATRSVVGGGGEESGWTMTLGGEEGAKLFAEHEAQRRRRTCFPQRDRANGAPCFAQRGQTMSFWSSSLLFGRAMRVTEPTLGSSCDVSTRPLCRAVSASSCNASLLGFTKEHDLRFESCRKRSTARELPDRSFFAFANDRHASFEAKLASHIGEARTPPRVSSLRCESHSSFGRRDACASQTGAETQARRFWRFLTSTFALVTGQSRASEPAVGPFAYSQRLGPRAQGAESGS